MCVLMVWKGTDIAHSVKEAILETENVLLHSLQVV